MAKYKYSTFFSLIFMVIALVLLVLNWGDIEESYFWIILIFQSLSIIISGINVWAKNKKSLNITLVILNILPLVFYLVAFAYGLTQGP